jgi:hypothetical protein
MRFAKTIKQIQGLQAYHAGDKLNVEVDIVLDASTSLKDSHDLAYVFYPPSAPHPCSLVFVLRDHIRDSCEGMLGLWLTTETARAYNTC